MKIFECTEPRKWNKNDRQGGHVTYLQFHAVSAERSKAVLWSHQWMQSGTRLKWTHAFYTLPTELNGVSYDAVWTFARSFVRSPKKSLEEKRLVSEEPHLFFYTDVCWERGKSIIFCEITMSSTCYYKFKLGISLFLPLLRIGRIYRRPFGTRLHPNKRR